jgi:sec-independent protein translocase protein TatA
MPNFGVWEWLIILIIVLVIFGASRLRDLGKGLGGAINAFRSEVKSGREQEQDAQSTQGAQGTQNTQRAQPNEEGEADA